MKKLVVGTLAVAVTAFAMLSAGAGAQEPAPPLQENKIALDVQQALAVLPAGERLPIIVTFQDQADLTHIKGAARAKHLERVIGTLQQTARTTQRPFRAVLEEPRIAQGVDAVAFFWIFNGLSLTASAEAITEIASRPEVRSITLDKTILAPEPFQAQTLLSLSPSEENIALINAPALWHLGFQGEGVVVANMDTGVSVSHPDLIAQWRGGTNSWFDPYGEHPSSPVDLNGHGTATMGVMVGRDAGGTNIGVAPLAQWIAVKIFDDRGQATTTAIHQGFQWLLDPDGDPSTPDAPHVVNNSWRVGNADCDLAFQLDLQALRAANIVPVFSAGNTGPGDATSVSPANNPEAFAVGATDNADQVWVYSAHGPSACGEPETLYPEMVAPGVDILTAGLYGTYRTVSGTSLSAPHIAGALALLLSAYPNLTIAQQEAALLSGAVDLGPTWPDNTYGKGRLDVLAAYGGLSESIHLSITKLDNPDPVGVGTTLTYTLVITNAGPSTASVVTVTDELPAGVTYGTAWGDGWSCDQPEGKVTCSRSSLGLGMAASITITVTTPKHTGTITNTATVSGFEVDLDPKDNTASAATLVRPFFYVYLPVILR
jgi:uncharacterized repeat protein (TIGR01451 family)